MNEFEFELGVNVHIDGTEVGTVIARTQYQTAENRYLLRYQIHDVETVERWWGESCLKEVD